MMKTHISIVVIFFLFLFSCEKDVMDQTIFIPDKKDPNLPAYTEWGYNSFGAKYGSVYFLVSMSNNNITPCTISSGNNQLQFELHGTIGNGEKMSLCFIFPSEPMSDYKDLVKLPKNEIALSAANDCNVRINNSPLQELDGKLHFRRVQLLSIDGTMERAILSGIFELNFTKDGSHETISNGRFDLGINDKVFYNQ